MQTDLLGGNPLLKGILSHIWTYSSLQKVYAKCFYFYIKAQLQYMFCQYLSLELAQKKGLVTVSSSYNNSLSVLHLPAITYYYMLPNECEHQFLVVPVSLPVNMRH